DLSGVKFFECAADISIRIKVELRADPRPKRDGEATVNERLELRAGPHGRRHDPPVTKEDSRPIRARHRHRPRNRYGTSTAPLQAYSLTADDDLVGTDVVGMGKVLFRPARHSLVRARGACELRRRGRYPTGCSLDEYPLARFEVGRGEQKVVGGEVGGRQARR